MQNTEYLTQNTEYRIQNTEYRIHNSEYRIQNKEYKIQNTAKFLQGCGSSLENPNALTPWVTSTIPEMDWNTTLAATSAVRWATSEPPFLKENTTGNSSDWSSSTLAIPSSGKPGKGPS